MPPAIVYSDMDDSADARGSVFAGKKFFLVQRLPSRSTYISHIENNGGRVVKLEAQSDYLIADHLRRDAPPNALSYRFIDEALKQGAVPEDTTPFLIQTQRSTSHVTTTVASSSNKTTRTPFTADDDKLLYAWVETAKHIGLATKGNELYKILAEYNTRHTPQSWLARYVKTLDARPPTGWESYSEHVEAQLSKLSDTLPSSTAPPASHSPSDSRTKSRVAFTREDDELLEAWVNRAVKHGELERGNKIYQDLEAHNSRHTAQSWRDRYIKHLARNEYDDEGEEEVADASTSIPATKSPKKTRTPFTEADDQELLAWIRQAQQNREHLLGHEIYKKLEKRNPRHSYHSWRDRYMKRFMVKDGTEDSTPLPAPSSRTSVPTTRRPPAEQPVSSPPRESAVHDTPSTAARRPTSISKNQANTPMARAHASASDPLSRRPQVSGPASRDVSTQTNLNALEHDDSTFTRADFDCLLGEALNIQNVLVGRYQEAWDRYSGAYPEHTAAEWRSFYERRVLPVALGKQDDPAFQNFQRDDARSNFWLTQGQPILTLPYLEQRPASDNEGDVMGKPETDKSPTPRASAPRVIDGQVAEDSDPPIKVEDNGQISPSKRKLQASEATEQSQAHKRRRVGLEVASSPKAAVGDQADQAIENNGEQDVISISSRKSSASGQGLNEDHDTGEDEAEANEQLLREMKELSRPQLTQANLARAQAENGSPKGNRGVDLAEDDEEEDQGDFASYLDNLLPAAAKERIRETIEASHPASQDDQPRVSRSNKIQYLDPDLSPVRELDPAEYEEYELEQSPALLSQVDQPDEENGGFEDDADMQHDQFETQLNQSLTHAPSNRNNRLDTQQIYEAETQPFDFDMPDPPEQDKDEDTQAVESDSQFMAEEDLWPFIDNQKAKGFSEEDISSALRCTGMNPPGMNPKLATLVLEVRGEQLNMPGVWSAKEDAQAEGGNAGLIRRLEEKHGRGAVMRRLEFLREWRQDEEEALREEGGMEE